MNFLPWQRASILAAVSYLKEQTANGARDPRADALGQGLLEVLEPSRRTARLQREAAHAAKSAALAGHERRRAAERRAGADRRKHGAGGWPGIGWSGPERRSGHDRRSGRDRRAAD